VPSSLCIVPGASRTGIAVAARPWVHFRSPLRQNSQDIQTNQGVTEALPSGLRVAVGKEMSSRHRKLTWATVHEVVVFPMMKWLQQNKPKPLCVRAHTNRRHLFYALTAE